MTYQILDAVSGTVYGERSNVKDARRLAKKYEGAVVRVKQHPAIVSISYEKPGA